MPQTIESRRERERQMRRDSILQAAKEVFAEKGYGSATLDEIAQRAEFGKGTLYNYFPGGKEGLLIAIFDQMFDQLEALIKEAFRLDRLTEETLRPTLTSFIETYAGFFRQRENLFFILLKEAHRMCFGENMEHFQYFRQQRMRMHDALLVPIQHAMAAGWIREMDPSMVAHMILHNIEGLQVHLLMERYAEEDQAAEPVSYDTAVSSLATLLLDGFTAHSTTAVTD